MNQDQAELVATAALEWLASDSERIGGFFGVSGADPEDFKGGIGDPALLIFVLDYLLSDDAMVMAFADQTAFSPQDPMRARLTLAPDEAENCL